MEHCAAPLPAAPCGGGNNSRVCSTSTSSSWRTHTTHCSSSNDTASQSDCSCRAWANTHTQIHEAGRVVVVVDNIVPSREKQVTLGGVLCTWLSARLVMLALVARWATKAASKAAAALWDWMHVERTCCHQGETDWVSHDSSTAPGDRKNKGSFFCRLSLFEMS